MARNLRPQMTRLTTCLLIAGLSGLVAVAAVVAWSMPTNNTFSLHWVKADSGLSVARSPAVALSRGPQDIIFAIGGSRADTASSQVDYTILQTDGSPQNWSATTPLPTSLLYHAAVSIANRIYVIGGGQSPSTLTNIVYCAEPNLSGTVGIPSWHTNTLDRKLGTHAAVAVGNRIYVLGGYESPNGLTKAVKSADVGINCDTPLVWRSENDLLFKVGNHSATAATVNGKNFIYVVGGLTDGGQLINVVQRAEVLASGELGTWANLGPVTGMPGVQLLASVVTGDYLYASGGSTDLFAQTSVNAIYRAAILGNGDLGPWLSTTLPTSLHGHAAAVSRSGQIYLVGGKSNTNYLDSVYFTPLAWISKSADPSTLIKHGDYITYTIVVTNNGLFIQTNLRVTDTLSANTDVVLNGITDTLHTTVWLIPELGPNATHTISFAVHVPPLPPVEGPECAKDENGNAQTILVDRDVVIDFNPYDKNHGDIPICDGDIHLCPYFKYDVKAAEPEKWRAIFDVHNQKLVVTNGAKITILGVPANGNNQHVPGLEIRSDCALRMDEGTSIKLDPRNRPGGDIILRIAGNAVISGLISNHAHDEQGIPGDVLVASCCGDITLNPPALIETVGQDVGGGDITIETCCGFADSNIIIGGLVGSTYKGGTPPKIEIASMHGSVTISGTYLLDEVWYGERLTSGVAMRATGEGTAAGSIRIQAGKNITVYGNTIFNWRDPNPGAISVKKESPLAAGGDIDARAMGGRIAASDRAFDSAGRFNQNTTIKLFAQNSVILVATTRPNSVPNGGNPYLKDVVSTQSSQGQGGKNVLRAHNGTINITANARVLADHTNGDGADGSNVFSSYFPMTIRGIVNPTYITDTSFPSLTPTVQSCEGLFKDIEEPVPPAVVIHNSAQVCNGNLWCLTSNTTTNVFLPLRTYLPIMSK